MRFQTVQLGRDFGTTVEITNGLGGRDRVLVAPTDALQDGAVVQVVPDGGYAEYMIAPA